MKTKEQVLSDFEPVMGKSTNSELAEFDYSVARNDSHELVTYILKLGKQILYFVYVDDKLTWFRDEKPDENMFGAIMGYNYKIADAEVKGEIFVTEGPKNFLPIKMLGHLEIGFVNNATEFTCSMWDLIKTYPDLE